MQVKDLTIHQVECIDQGASLRHALEIMQSIGVEPLPICREGRFVGMVTRESIQQTARETGLAAGLVPVAKAVLEAVAVSADQPIEQAADLLDEQPGGKLLPGLIVVDREGGVVGVVTAVDLRHGTEVVPAVTGAYGASEPKVSVRTDPVDHDAEESFPASDPPPPPSMIAPEQTEEC